MENEPKGHPIENLKTSKEGTVPLRFRRVGVLFTVLLLVLATGCAHPFTPPRYQPQNIYRSTEVLPPALHRVAVLPLSIATATPWLEAGEDALRPSILAELQKSKRFELVLVTPEQLELWTGRKEWKADDALPEDFFQRLYRNAGNDAVLFCQLTGYHPYPPLEIGWKFTLVANTSPWKTIPGGDEKSDTLREKGGILWSADEVFNAGAPAVAHSAQSYLADHGRNKAPLADSTSVLSSPIQFGQYTLHALFETMPSR